jgi:bifunctional non-homologous end joining protein LigD
MHNQTDKRIEKPKKNTLVTSVENVELNSGGREKFFVIHKHMARRLHYDLRLERDGVLKSWAAPKEIPINPGVKRLAIETEDHPIGYGEFEGEIPEGQYGAGKVEIWDSGLYEPLIWGEDKIEFILKGKKLHGKYILLKFKKAGEKEWILLKSKKEI